MNFIRSYRVIRIILLVRSSHILGDKIRHYSFMLWMLYFRNNFSRNCIYEFGDKQIKRYSEKKPRDTHKMLGNKEYNKYYRGGYIERFPYKTRIEKIAFNHMDDAEHHNNRDDYSPPRVAGYGCQKYGNTTYKDAQNWYEAC